MSRFLWKCGGERTHNDPENLMLEKCVSILLHLAGIHRWEGRFVDIFNDLVGARVFPQRKIHDIWMRSYLACDHGEILVENILNPNSDEFNMLLDDLCTDSRLIQLHRSAHVISTSSLESHHSVVLSYRPKRYH